MHGSMVTYIAEPSSLQLPSASPAFLMAMISQPPCGAAERQDFCVCRGVVSGLAQIVSGGKGFISTVGDDGAYRDFAHAPGYTGLFDSQAHESFVFVFCHREAEPAVRDVCAVTSSR